MRTGMLALALVLGAPLLGAQETAAPRWTAKEVRVVEGFNTPESVCPDVDAGVVYVSNVEALEGQYWSNDRKCHISLLTPEGGISQARWLDSTAESVINGPKGMCRLGDYLYFADISRLMRISTESSGAVPEEIQLPETRMLNDLATDGKYVYVSDTGLGRVYRVDETGEVTRLPALPGANGLAFHKGHLFGVSWDQHEVFELDPDGKELARPLGLAQHFASLDGIEALDDGSLIVSDFTGNKVCVISPDGKTVGTLVELESPADIGLDRKRGLLYVPQFMKDRVVICQLTRE